MPIRRRKNDTTASLDHAFRSMIQREVSSQLEPLQSALVKLEQGAGELIALRQLADRLTPLASLLGGTVSRRGAGRTPAIKGRGHKRGDVLARERGCAIVGCRRPSRTKGYCAAHYQKLRMLTRTHRRPSGWVDFASPNSIPDVVLPRGRAAHKSRSHA